MDGKVSGIRFPLYLLGFTVFLASGGVLKRGLFIDQHEGDMLHLVDIVMRMSMGQVPHLDFVTPLGAMAFLPFSSLIAAGLPIGAALIWGQVAFALLLLPLVWWVAYSRLTEVQAYGFASAVLILALAFIYGNTEPNTSFSMHYNRWAWALSLIAIVITVVPTQGSSAVLDGLVLGIAMSFMVFGKITYGVALTPGLLLACVLTGQWRACLIGSLVLLGVALLLTFWAGSDIWVAYISDLRLVSSTDIRPRAGESWSSLLFSPKFIIAHAVLVSAVVYLRQRGDTRLGAILALLAPGFIFITYQNFGNDPIWLACLAVLCFGGTADKQTRLIGAAAALLIAPSFANMASSPFRHLMQREAAYKTVFDAHPLDDLFTKMGRDQGVSVAQALKFEGPHFADLNRISDDTKVPRIGDEVFEPCLLNSGLLGMMRAIAQDLTAEGLAQSHTVFTADTFGSFWLFGDLDPTVGGAPWYYGGLTGLNQADYVLVPRCAITPRAQKSILSEISERGLALRQIRKTELYVLFERD